MSESNAPYLDLSLVILYTGGTTFALLHGVDGVLRIAIAIPLVVFLPGYAFISLLYPDDGRSAKPFDDPQTGLHDPIVPRQGLDTVVRIAFAFVLSALIVAVIGAGAALSPLGLSPGALLLGTGLFTIAVSLLATLARYRYPRERRFVPSIHGIFITSRGAYGSTGSVRIFNVLLVVSLLLLGGTVGYALLDQPRGEPFTEFSVETEEVTGETETMYTSRYTAGESQPLTLHVANHEHRNVEYTTVVVLQRVSYDDGEPTVREESELVRDSITVADGERQPQTVEITPTMTGDDLRLLVLLYEGGAPEDPGADTAYRVLRLPIEVT